MKALFWLPSLVCSLVTSAVSRQHTYEIAMARAEEFLFEKSTLASFRLSCSLPLHQNSRFKDTRSSLVSLIGVDLSFTSQHKEVLIRREAL